MMHGIEYGNLTVKEKALTFYLGDCLANYLEKVPTERGEMLAAMTVICTTLFVRQTPIKDIDKQCNEIDAFCETLKLNARKPSNE